MKRILGLLLLLVVVSVSAATLRYTSSTATVTTASSVVVAGGQGYQVLTVQNTHASNTLYLSAACPATTADLQLPAGSGYVFNPAPANDVCAVASASGTTVSILGGKL